MPAVKVNRATTGARLLRGGGATIHSNCFLAATLTEATREEVVERAREIARANRHARFTVIDETGPCASIEMIETVPAAERHEAARSRIGKMRSQHTGRARRSRHTGEVLGDKCGYCYEPLRTKEEKRAFVCRWHMVPVADDVRRDLEHHAQAAYADLPEGARRATFIEEDPVGAYEEELQAAADRARTVAYRKAGRLEELYEIAAY